MSKAEDLAKEYCEGSSFEDACMERPAYIAGYHQAEKDNELTLKDIEAIDQIFTDVFKDGFDVTTNKYYKEVLNRFNKQKGR
jgi:hypothetical protein